MRPVGVDKGGPRKSKAEQNKQVDGGRRGEDGRDQGEACARAGAREAETRRGGLGDVRTGKASAGGQGETVFVVPVKRFGK